MNPASHQTALKSSESHRMKKSNKSKIFLPEKIVTGGQTGVDRAALDAAIALGIAYGGWCPRGRLAEDGTIPSHYEMEETASSEYKVRTRQNVIDSDATLIIYDQRLRGGTLLTQKIALELDKPMLCRPVQGLLEDDVREWLESVRPKVLNIAGPRESSNPGIYTRSFAFLMAALM